MTRCRESIRTDTDRMIEASRPRSGSSIPRRTLAPAARPRCTPRGADADPARFRGDGARHRGRHPWATQLFSTCSRSSRKMYRRVGAICPSRPDLTAPRPGWGGGRRNASGIALSRSRGDADRSRRSYKIDDLPEVVRAKILDAPRAILFPKRSCVIPIDERHCARRSTMAGRVRHRRRPDSRFVHLCSPRVLTCCPSEQRLLQPPRSLDVCS